MGLGEEELLDAAAVSETLKCPVCFEVFDDPVFCGGRPCQHVFCRECVEQALEMVEQCPTCRAEMSNDDLQPHLAIRNLLDEMPCRCPRGCGWTGRRDARASHEDACPLARLEAATAELEKLADISRQLHERDARILELEARVAEQDDQVVDVSRQLVARQLRIVELEGRVQKQDAALDYLRTRLAELLGEQQPESELQTESVEDGYAGEIGEEICSMDLVEFVEPLRPLEESGHAPDEAGGDLWL